MHSSIKYVIMGEEEAKERFFMDKIVKRIIIFVFTVFVVLTLLIFVLSDSITASKLLIIAAIAAVIVLYAKFPVISEWKINRTRPLLLAAAASSLFLRIVWVYFVKAIPVSDFYTYHSLAGALVNGEILYPKFISLFPHVFGYSKVLSVVYSIFGPRPDSAVAFNIALNIGILLLIYLIGKILHDEKTGLVSAVIYAFWPSQIFYNSLVLTEPFFTFGLLFLIAVYLYAVKHINNIIRRFAVFLFIGITAGFLNYIRPAVVILVISLLIHYLLMEYKYNLRDKDGKTELLIRAGICVLMIVSYTAVSSFVSGRIGNRIGIEVAKKPSGFYILAGLNIESEGRWSEKDSVFLESLISEGLTSDQIHEQLAETGLKRLKEMDLFSFIKLQVNKNKHMWGNDHKSITYIQNSVSPASRVNISKHAVWLTFAADAYYFLFLALSFAALFFVKNNDKEKINSGSYVFYLYILGTVAAHMLAEVHSRYHYPVIPLLCLAAGIFFSRLNMTGFLIRNKQKGTVPASPAEKQEQSGF